MALSAPLSVVPGRIRFEDPSLLGQVQVCRHLQKRIIKMEGVIDASVNHRTGRILVKFDESRIGKDDFKGIIEEILNDTIVYNTASVVGSNCFMCYGSNCRSYTKCDYKISNGFKINTYDLHLGINGMRKDFDRGSMKDNVANGKISLHIVRHLLIDVVSHMILPKPFHVLLPIMIYALKRKSVL